MASSSGNSTADGRSMSSSGSLGSSSSVSSSQSSSTATQQSSSAVQHYPLAWAGDSPGVCVDFGNGETFCISASLRFWNATSSVTTITEGNATTIVFDSTTTIISGISTGVIGPRESSSHAVDLTLLIQDAVTGQNTTLSDGCYIQTTLHTTECLVGSRDVPVGHTYKVTVLVTAQDHKTLLAPPRTITVSV
jgi:hypothetical protein